MTQQIKISGVPPQFDQAALEEKQNKRVEAFLKTSQSSYRMQAHLPDQFLIEFARLSALGYTLTDYPIQMSPANYVALLHQPQSVLDPLIADIRAKVKADYISELESEHERYKAMLIEQLKQADLAKELEAKAAQEAKQLAKYEKLAADCFTPLVIPKS